VVFALDGVFERAVAGAKVVEMMLQRHGSSSGEGMVTRKW